MSGLISSHNYVVNFGSTDVDQQPTILGSTFAGAPFTFIAPYSNADHVASPNKGKTIGLASITDGTSNTMLASELITGADNDLRGLTWWADGTTYTSYLPPNSPLFDQMYSNGACKGGLIISPPCKVVPDGGSEVRRRPQQASRRRASPLRRRQRQVHQEHDQPLHLARDQLDRGRRGHQRRCVLMPLGGEKSI